MLFVCPENKKYNIAPIMFKNIIMSSHNNLYSPVESDLIQSTIAHIQKINIAITATRTIPIKNVIDNKLIISYHLVCVKLETFLNTKNHKYIGFLHIRFKKISSNYTMVFDELQIIGLETIYALLVILPSLLIFSKTRKLFRFSNYKGIKYFSNAFLFFAIGFILRYFVVLNKIISGNLLATIQSFDLLLIAMEFFMIVPGMFLLYALVWKNFEHLLYSKKPVNLAIFLMYFVALLLAVLDYVFSTFLFLFVSQIILFSVASVIAYTNYRVKRQYFKQFYFISMFLFLVMVVVNLIAQYTINNFPIMRFYVYVITVVVVFLFLHITNKLTKSTSLNNSNQGVENVK